jgi:hypothetical protein
MLEEGVKHVYKEKRRIAKTGPPRKIYNEEYDDEETIQIIMDAHQNSGFGSSSSEFEV